MFLRATRHFRCHSWPLLRLARTSGTARRSLKERKVKGFVRYLHHVVVLTCIAYVIASSHGTAYYGI